jgi:hypothetical protein
MCELGHYTVATTLKTAVDAEQVVESQEDTVQGLFSAAAHVKTMPARPAIERSSITPGVVMVDNSQGIFQLVGPKRKVFVLQLGCLNGCLTVKFTLRTCLPYEWVFTVRTDGKKRVRADAPLRPCGHQHVRADTSLFARTRSRPHGHRRVCADPTMRPCGRAHLLALALPRPSSVPPRSPYADGGRGADARKRKKEKIRN